MTKCVETGMLLIGRQPRWKSVPQWMQRTSWLRNFLSHSPHLTFYMTAGGRAHLACQHLSLLVGDRCVEEDELVEAGSGNLVSVCAIFLRKLECF